MTVLGLYEYVFNVFLKIFHALPGDRFIAVNTKEIEEFNFCSTKFLTDSMFSTIILVWRGPGSLDRETSPETINLLITLEKM